MRGVSRGVSAIPIEIEYLEDGGLIGVASGTLTGRELIDANRAVYETPEKTRAIKYQIHDYRRVEGSDVSVAEVRQLAALDQQAARVNPNIVVAVIHSSDVGFGLSRMWQAYTGEFPFISRVFRSMDEARAWVLEQLKEAP